MIVNLGNNYAMHRAIGDMPNCIRPISRTIGKYHELPMEELDKVRAWEAEHYYPMLFTIKYRKDEQLAYLNEKRRIDW